MGPVCGRVERLDEGGMPLLHLRKRLRLLELGIRETELHLELSLDQVLPWLAFFDVANLDPQFLQEPLVRRRGEDRSVVRDDALRLAIRTQRPREQLENSHAI